MKENRILRIAIFALLISLIISVTCFASFDLKENATERQSIKVNAWIKRQTVPHKKVLTTSKSGRKELSYKHTHNLSLSKSIDVYLDEREDEYRFSTNGNLVGYYNADALNGIKKEVGIISEERAIEIARENGAELYGANFTELSFDSCQLKNDRTYYVYFSKKYGNEGYIEGPSAVISITIDGQVSFSSFPDIESYEKLDAEWLNAFSEADVRTAVAKQVQSAYGEALVEYEIQHFKVVYKNGEFVLEMPVNVYVSRADAVIKEPYGLGQVYYYEFSQ